MAMTDIFVLMVLAAALIQGYRMGIINQLGALLALVLAVLAARLVSHGAVSVTVVLTFLGVYIGVKLLAGGLRKVTHILMMGTLDRLCGAFFMALQALTVVSLLLNILVKLFPSYSFVGPATAGGGWAYEAIMDLWPWLMGCLGGMASKAVSAVAGA